MCLDSCRVLCGKEQGWSVCPLPLTMGGWEVGWVEFRVDSPPMRTGVWWKGRAALLHIRSLSLRHHRSITSCLPLVLGSKSLKKNHLWLGSVDALSQGRKHTGVGLGNIPSNLTTPGRDQLASCEAGVFSGSSQMKFLSQVPRSSESGVVLESHRIKWRLVQVGVAIGWTGYTSSREIRFFACLFIFFFLEIYRLKILCVDIKVSICSYMDVPLEARGLWPLELQMAVSYLMCMLDNKLGSSGRTAHALNSWAVFLVLRV